MVNEYYKWSKNGMKMIINTDFKEFNKQTNCISNGNVIANTEYGNYIRPYNETINPVGQVVEKGHLQKYDLQYFSLNGVDDIKDFLRQQDHSVILYEFFIWKKDEDSYYKKKNIIGWLIEDNGKIVYKKVNYLCNGNYVKRSNCLEYLKNLLEFKRSGTRC